MMIKARLTKAGAFRLMRNDLFGRIVAVDRLSPNGVAKNIYLDGKRIGGILSTKDDPGGKAALEVLDE